MIAIISNSMMNWKTVLTSGGTDLGQVDIRRGILQGDSLSPLLFWGGGGGKCPRRLQLSRTSLIFKQYLLNVATFTKIYWRTRFWKKFASKVSHVAMATVFSTPCLLKF